MFKNSGSNTLGTQTEFNIINQCNLQSGNLDNIREHYFVILCMGDKNM